MEQHVEESSEEEELSSMLYRVGIHDAPGPQEAVESSDEEPAASSTRGRGRGRVRGGGGAPRQQHANIAEWRRGIHVDVDVPVFTGHPGPLPPPEDVAVAHPIDLFITDDVLTLMLTESKRRAFSELARDPDLLLLRDFKPFKKYEIQAYIACVIAMGIVQLPDETDYWSTDAFLSFPFVANLLSRDRFAQIKHCLMVANPTPEQNAADKLAKVRVFLNMVRTVSQQRFFPHQDCSLDESQCQCGHRYARFAYRGETKKPIADYIKIISLHCAETGYCYNFLVDERTPGVKVADMVSTVCESLPPQPFRIATDRFYTTVDTAKRLLQRRLFMYGTIRTDRGIHKALQDEVAREPLADGETRWSMAPPQLLCCVWRDSTPTGVWFLSTCHDGAAVLGEVRRRKRGEMTALKSAPQVAVDYNKFMGGCDRANSLRSSYSTYLTHKKRWYMSLVYYGVDVLIVNAYIYHKAVCAAAIGPAPRSTITQKEFRMEVAKLFAARAVAASDASRRRAEQGQRVRRAFEDDLPMIRLQATVPHKPVLTTNKRQCVWCYKTMRKQMQTRYRCEGCGVHLHVGKHNCFALYHS